MLSVVINPIIAGSIAVITSFRGVGVRSSLMFIRFLGGGCLRIFSVKKYLYAKIWLWTGSHGL